MSMAVTSRFPQDLSEVPMSNRVRLSRVETLRPNAARWRYGLYVTLALLYVGAWFFDEKHSFPLLVSFAFLLFLVFVIETAVRRRL